MTTMVLPCSYMATTTQTIRVRMEDDVVRMLDEIVEHYNAKHPGMKVTRSSAIRLLIHQTHQIRERDLAERTLA